MPAPSSAYTVTGVAKIGLLKWSYQPAKLTATADRLTLRISLFGLFTIAHYSFSKDQVLSIELYGVVPFGDLADGIRINHSVADYPETIVFYCDAPSVLAGLTRMGFTSAHALSETPQRQAPQGFPLRWTPLIALSVLPYLPIAYGVLGNTHGQPSPRPITLASIWMLFGVCMAAIRLPKVQAMFMKPGRSFEEVKHLFVYVAYIIGFCSAILSFRFAAGAFQ